MDTNHQQNLEIMSSVNVATLEFKIKKYQFVKK